MNIKNIGNSNNINDIHIHHPKAHYKISMAVWLLDSFLNLTPRVSALVSTWAMHWQVMQKKVFFICKQYLNGCQISTNLKMLSSIWMVVFFCQQASKSVVFYCQHNRKGHLHLQTKLEGSSSFVNKTGNVVFGCKQI